MAHECGSCACTGSESTQGCTERLTEARIEEEVNSAPYLIIAGIIIFAASLILKWALA